MADLNQLITLGIGTPADVSHLILVGLNTRLLAPPRGIPIALADAGPIAIAFVDDGVLALPFVETGAIAIPCAGDNAVAAETNFDFARGEPVVLQGSFHAPPAGGLSGRVLMFIMKLDMLNETPAEVEEEVAVTVNNPSADEVCWELTLDHDRTKRIRPAAYVYEVSYLDVDPEINGRQLAKGTVTVTNRPRERSN